MQRRVDEELDKLLDSGVIEPVPKPPTWVNPLVKPFVTLFLPGSNPPPRIERRVTRLMGYDFKVVYQSGLLNSADYLLRSNPLPNNPKNGSMVMNYGNHIVKQSLPKALNLKEVVAATENDKELMKISDYIRTSWSMSERKSDYFKVCQHLSSSHGIMLFEKRILIPRSIRFKVITLAHEGHKRVRSSEATFSSQSLVARHES